MEVLFKNKNNEWVDFSDKLVRLSSLSHIAGDLITKSSLVTSISNLIMDNSNYFWEDLDNWNSDNWKFSKNNNDLFFKGTDVLIRTIQNDNINSLGIFKIAQFYTKNGLAYFKLESRAQWLKRKSADAVKNGHVWYKFRSISFLLEELLKQEYHEDAILGTVQSINGTNSTITIDVDTKPWFTDAVILRNNDEAYSIESVIDNNTIEVSYLESSGDVFNWVVDDNYKIDGTDVLPLSFNLPESIKIPTYNNIRIFSTLGKSPTDVKHNMYRVAS